MSLSVATRLPESTASHYPLSPIPFLSVYSAEQYGHFAHPVFSTGRNTLGWLFHSCMPGIGHESGRSSGVTSY